MAAKRLTRLPLVLVSAGLVLVASVGVGWIVTVVVRHPLTTVVIGVGLLAAGIVTGIVIRVAVRAFGPVRVLEWDLTHLPSDAAGGPFAALGGKAPMTVAGVVRALERAAKDRKVAGVVASISFGAARPAIVQELADAIDEFRASGKYTVAFADRFGGNWSYYLASCFDAVMLQPGGDVAATGFGAEPNFYRQALAKAGMEMLVDKRHEYKEAFDQLAEDAMTPPSREALQHMLDGLHAQLVDGIARRRNLDHESVQAVIDGAPLLADEAVASGLVDEIGYYDKAVERVRAHAPAKAKLLYLDRYAKRPDRGSGSTVALLTATGAMVTRRGNPLGGRSPMVAGDVAKVLRKAAGDKRVKAIVLRVDTPGGEVTAAETIHREIVRARAAGKPVVLSMSGVAASGGYYIAAAADKVVAQPGTITGSIGVVTAKPVVRDLKERLGIRPEVLATAKHANMASINRPYSESEQARLDAGLDAIYQRFVELVAEGRRMEPDAVHSVAKGRVWLGADARDLGLVDELGGLPVALREAKALAGIDPVKPARLKAYPRKPSPLAAFRSRRGQSSEDLKAAFAQLSSVLAAIDSIGLQPKGALHCGLDERMWLQP